MLFEFERSKKKKTLEYFYALRGSIPTLTTWQLMTFKLLEQTLSKTNKNSKMTFKLSMFICAWERVKKEFLKCLKLTWNSRQIQIEITKKKTLAMLLLQL